MPVDGYYYDSARVRNPEQSAKFHPATLTNASIIRELRRGYGVEDIGVRLNCGPDAPRRIVRRLREQGLLDRVYGKGGAA